MTDYKTNEYKPNANNLKVIVEKLYHAFSGDEPDDKMRERLYAGVEGMIQLYEENRNAFYAIAAVSLLEGTEKLGLKSHYGEIIMKYLAQSMIEESACAPKDNKSKSRSNLGGN